MGYFTRRKIMTKHLAPDFIYTPQGLQSNMLITISDVGLITSITPVGAQFIIPFRLPEPQARTQSVGSRNTDPIPFRLPEPHARTQSFGSRHTDPAPSDITPLP